MIFPQKWWRYKHYYRNQNGRGNAESTPVALIGSRLKIKITFYLKIALLHATIVNYDETLKHFISNVKTKLRKPN